MVRLQRKTSLMNKCGQYDEGGYDNSAIDMVVLLICSLRYAAYSETSQWYSK